jgi:arylsulfatase A-like enzyme
MRYTTSKTDQPTAALIKDLKRLGMLEDTLVVWGGEFGRTSYSQGKISKDNYGRDHHPRCFSLWMAGGGVKGGYTHGQTDPYGYNIADASGNAITPTKDVLTPGAVHVHDLQATILHLLGVDHTKLTYRYQGRDFRLTDVHGHVVPQLLA